MQKIQGDKLEVGTAVNVHALSGIHIKGGANGHTCRIEKALAYSDYNNNIWKYKLEWHEADNPGRKYPICINQYYFIRSELTALFPMYPESVGDMQDLPDV